MTLNPAFQGKLEQRKAEAGVDGVAAGTPAELPLVLIVDDEPQITRSVAALLGGDYRVLTANSADEALKLLEQNSVSVILSDQRMPGTSGAEFLARSLTIAPEATRILFSGYSDISAVIEAVNEGKVYHYLAKPWRPEELKAVVGQGFERHRLAEDNRRLLEELARANAELEQRVLQRTEQLAEQNAALRASEQRWREILVHIPQIGVSLDRQGRIVFANRHLLQLTGWTEEEMLGQDWFELCIPEPIRAEVRGVFATTMREENATPISHYENEILTRSGALRSVAWANAVTKDAQGAIVEVTSLGVDITERERLASALRESEVRYRGIFEGSSAVMLLIDAASGSILDANPAACKWYGWSRKQLLAKHIGEINTMPGPELEAAIGAALESDGGLIVTAHRLADGRIRDVQVFSTPLEIQGQKLFHSVIQDVTERRQAEAEILRLNAELEQRVRARTAELEATSQELEAFAYSVSHDLRAPLRHISGFANILAEDAADALDEDARGCLDTITESVREMGVLIDDLLQFSRTGRTELQIADVDMEEVLSEALVPIRDETADRAIEWSIGPLPHVVGDHALLRQVWANLLGNAVKFTRPRDPARIEIGARDSGADSRNCVFFVRDNGVGFDMAYVGKLFRVFQRLHSAAEFEGTGIGLANVKRIVTRLGGRVWAEAELDKGATFSFALPRTKESR